jgi:PAS domain S-box-containing protein
LRKLRRSEFGFLDVAPNPILIIAPDTSITYVNPAFEELTGFTSEELVTMRFPHPWWPEESAEEVKAFLEDAFRRDKRKVERLLQKKNGEQFWVEINSTLVKEKGKVKYLLANWVDITERNQFMEQLKKYGEQLRDLTAHMESVREKERLRISRDLHDELGQVLIALKIDASWLSDNLSDSPRLSHEKLQSMIKMIDTSLDVVRRVCAELRPRLLDELGLVAAVEWLAEQFQESSHITCNVRASLDDSDFNDDMCVSIFRICQQALINVFRHSSASSVTISLKQENGSILLNIHDNGKGITKEQILNPKSFGLIGMQERTKYIGGEFRISGSKSRGTRIEITIPVADKGTPHVESVGSR